MDTEVMLYVFGPMIGYCVGVAIAFACCCYAVYKDRS